MPGYYHQHKEAVTEMIVHFANPENLQQISKELRPKVIATLHHLQQMFCKAEKYSEVLFNLVDLHTLENEDLTIKREEEFRSWY